MSSFAELLELENTLVSADLYKEQFVCDLDKCKGACCVEGDLGAPLEEEELKVLEEDYESIKPYLSEEGRTAIEEQGKYVLDNEGDYSTPLIDGKECAYVIRDEKNVLKCGIEQAYLAKETTFHKPISCHLYPVRVAKLANGMEALNYDRWPICDQARLCGQALKVPVYQFVKNALVRKYGKEWFDALSQLVKLKEEEK